MNLETGNIPTERLEWAKSSYSGSDGGDCVEVATSTGVVHVRDSKDRHGPTLRFSPKEWSAFISFTGSLPATDR